MLSKTLVCKCNNCKEKKPGYKNKFDMTINSQDNSLINLRGTAPGFFGPKVNLLIVSKSELIQELEKLKEKRR